MFGEKKNHSLSNERIHLWLATAGQSETLLLGMGDDRNKAWAFQYWPIPKLSRSPSFPLTTDPFSKAILSEHINSQVIIIYPRVDLVPIHAVLLSEGIWMGSQLS